MRISFFFTEFSLGADYQGKIKRNAIIEAVDNSAPKQRQASVPFPSHSARYATLVGELELLLTVKRS